MLLIALALVAFYAIFARTHFLLWLPLCAALQLVLMIIVSLYSPAFFDADFFHQRIVIEDLLLVLFAPLDWLGVRAAIRDLLAPRRAGDPELRVLVPFRNRYLFLWANDVFAYADVRPLKSAGGGTIIDYERIQPAAESGRSWRTRFGPYLWNRLQGASTETLLVAVTTNESGKVAAVIVAGSERSR